MLPEKNQPKDKHHQESIFEAIIEFGDDLREIKSLVRGLHHTHNEIANDLNELKTNIAVVADLAKQLASEVLPPPEDANALSKMRNDLKTATDALAASIPINTK